MYYTKVILHHVFFIVIFYYILLSDMANVYIWFCMPSAYIASYIITKGCYELVCWNWKVNSENKCVLITGCASGFGYHSAIELNKLGFKVFATCRDPNTAGAKRLTQIAANPKKMIVMGMDVTNDEDIERAFKDVQNAMIPSEKLYGLVNNAGTIEVAELEFRTDLTECHKILDVNLIGVIKVTRKFLPLIRQSQGRIVNVESVGGLVPVMSHFFYGVSKTAAIGFSDNLRLAMYKFGVTTVSIMPWIYKTQLNDTKKLFGSIDRNFENSTEEVRKAYGARYVEAVKNALTYLVDQNATSSMDVPNAIVNALTAYEPNPRYIVSPMELKPLAAVVFWASRDTYEVLFQLMLRFIGLDKAYPEY